MDYTTSHYILGESAPESQPQKTLSEIVFLVKERLSEALNDDKSGLAGNHPRVIISMVITNILVNLIFNSIAISDVSRRMEMVNDSLDEIREMTMNLWGAMEANRANTNIAH